MLDDDELARRIGAAGRAFVEAEHDWGSVARKHQELYREIAHATAGDRA
jgi:glycosyltransferase involved in cell wall biosynthesis